MRTVSLLGVAAIAVFATAGVCRAESAARASTDACLFAHQADLRNDDAPKPPAVHGSAAIDCLISEVFGKAAAAIRAEAALALVRTMTDDDPPLDAATEHRVRMAIVRVLRDRSFEVRVATVTALGEFGDEAMIPALQLVMSSDSTFSLRDYTAGAIARIRKRTRAVVSADVSATRQ